VVRTIAVSIDVRHGSLPFRRRERDWSLSHRRLSSGGYRR
jgi:hypothetical protein